MSALRSKEIIVTMKHCDRPWWKRPPVWLVAIVVVLIVASTMERGDGQGQVAYSAFLDQVDSGNVASVTFQGMEIIGRFKHPAETGSPATGVRPNDTFRYRIPDAGDPGLIPALRKQHVAIDVISPAVWATLLGHLPWPLLIFIGAMLMAGLIRFVRRGQAPSGQGIPVPPMHGMMGFVARFFTKQPTGDNSTTRNNDGPKK
jgi:ATP-dependent Zn protease